MSWQHVLRKNLVVQVEQVINRGGKVAVTGGRGIGKILFKQQVGRKLKTENKLLIIENPLQAVLLHEEQPDVTFMHLEELPEAAARTLMKEAVSSEIQMQCILDTVGGHPGNLQRIHDALMALLPKYLTEKAQVEYEIRTGKRSAPSAETRMLEVDALSVERDKVVAELGSQYSVLAEEGERFLIRMREVEHEVLSQTSDDLTARLFLLESVRYVRDKLKVPGFLPVKVNFGDIKHPVVQSFLRHEILYPGFVPLPRLVCESTLTRKFLDAWVNAKGEELSLVQRAKYNALLMSHRHEVVRRMQLF
jgi:hypothetical protein